MKKFAVALVLCVITLTPLVSSARGVENKKFGVGVNVGEPFGVNSRYFFTDQFVGDLTVGFGYVGERSFVVQPTGLFYLRHILTLDDDNFSLVPYFGLGFKTGVDTWTPSNQFIAAMRVPLGVAFVVKEVVFEITGEYATGFRFNPNAGYDYTGGIGLRFYFM